MRKAILALLTSTPFTQERKMMRKLLIAAMFAVLAPLSAQAGGPAKVAYFYVEPNAADGNIWIVFDDNPQWLYMRATSSAATVQAAIQLILLSYVGKIETNYCTAGIELTCVYLGP